MQFHFIDKKTLQNCSKQIYCYSIEQTEKEVQNPSCSFSASAKVPVQSLTRMGEEVDVSLSLSNSILELILGMKEVMM